MTPTKLPFPLNSVFPNFIPGKFPLSPDFKLWPDAFFPELGGKSLPSTPPIPPTVVTGDVITASHENTVTTAINDLWINEQWLAANSMVNPTTTKGDLIVSDGTTPNRMAVGAPGTVLTADSAQTLGVKWAAPAVAGVSSVFTRVGAVVAQPNDYTAAQVQNAVDKTGSYPNPAWITSLAWSKITGAPVTGVSSVFTRVGAVVAQANDYTAAQVQNAVDATGSYANPVWLTSLAWGKLTGVPPMVPTSTQIIAGAGLSGGGPLTGPSVTLAAVPMGASGPATHAAGIVPDPGATAGGTRYLREDATWAIPSGTGGGLTDPTTAKGDLIVRGTSAVTNLAVGSNGQVLTADSSQVVGVKWAAAPGALQSPWTTDIDAATDNLGNVLSVGIGVPAQGANLPFCISSSHTNYTIYATNSNTNGAAVVVLNNDGANKCSVGIGGAASVPIFRRNNAFLSSDGDIVFGTQTAERVRITNAGLVGIGTSTPTSFVHASLSQNSWTQAVVQNTFVGTVAAALVTAAASNAGISLMATSGGYTPNGSLLASEGCVYSQQNLVLASDGAAIKFIAGAGMTERMRIIASGNVGINTGTPTALMHVVYQTTGMQPTSALRVEATGDPNYAVIDIAVPGMTWQIGAGSVSSYFPNCWFLYNATTGSYPLFCKSNGYVGIGTSAPVSYLTVSAPAAAPSLTAANQIVSVLAGSGGNGQVLEIGAYNVGPYWGTWVQGSYGNNAGFTTPITLQPLGGGVGIGIANPLAVLHVAGTFIHGVPTTQSVADGSIGNSQVFAWYDEAGGRLVFRVKSSAGVLKTGYVSVA